MKGAEHHQNERKKPKLTLKEKRLKKREKKSKFNIEPHDIRDVYKEE